MNVIVTGEKMIADIQEEFHRQFPFLKVEFFQQGPPVSESFKNKVPPNKTFGSFKTNNHTEEITIAPAMTVNEFEEKFSRHYGLLALVYRQSGKVWLETTLTDSWTLKEQNEQGKALST